MKQKIEITDEAVHRARKAIRDYYNDPAEDRAPGFTEMKLALEAALNPPYPTCSKCGKPEDEHERMVLAPTAHCTPGTYVHRICPGAFFEASE